MVALPLGLTEPLFVGRYWDPPSLFDLARRTGFDLESMVFAFAVGGLAGALYDVAAVSDRRSPRAPGAGVKRALQWTLVAPVAVVAAVLFVTGRPMLAGVLGLTAGGMLRFAFLPELREKSVVGAALFTAVYGVTLLALAVLAPDPAARLWLDAGPRLGPIPLSEVAFAASFGLFWSGLYEQVAWLTGVVASS